MSEQFGASGRLRIRQAIADGNVAAVEAATMQFFGTEAAAEAHVWLGDRAVSTGAFAHALGQYRQAERTAGSDFAAQIAASEQLAAALLGQDGSASRSPATSRSETRSSVPPSCKLWSRTCANIDWPTISRLGANAPA